MCVYIYVCVCVSIYLMPCDVSKSVLLSGLGLWLRDENLEMRVFGVLVEMVAKPSGSEHGWASLALLSLNIVPTK